jgi:alkyl hydroperoxide reductase subunit AhpF
VCAIAVLRPEDRKAVEAMFAGAQRKVGLLVLSRGPDVPPAFHDVLAELAEIVPNLTVQERPWDEVADARLSERAPALVLLDGDGQPTGVRFSGYPTGYEFSTLVGDLADLAHGRTALSQPTLDFLAELREPLSIKVFTTPT